MVRFGSYGNLFSLPPWDTNEMPTAIITSTTRQGFFIGADGLSRAEKNGVFTPLTHKQQKIFPITDRRARFAFAVSGSAAFTCDNETEIIFDFNQAIREAAARLSGGIYADATNYCQHLARTVNQSLKNSVLAARAEGRSLTYPSNPDPIGQQTREMITMLFICGYYSRTSCNILFEFFHRSGELAAPLILKTLNIGDFSASGSTVVSNLLFGTTNPDFAPFRHVSVRYPIDLDFTELLTIARDYIAACESPRARALDPNICEGIGGHVHAAKVTQEGGFEWIVPPLP